jgi:hypothetical protein
LSELERVTQSNVAMAEELNGSSDVLRNQVIELQTRTRNFRLDNGYQTEGPRLLCLARCRSSIDPDTQRDGKITPGMPGVILYHHPAGCTVHLVVFTCLLKYE